jgi:Outer membrane protein beta-barrel domain
MRRPIDRQLLRHLTLPLCFALIVCAVSNLFAQSSCEDPEATLIKATDEFNAGHFYGLSAILKPCLDNKAFTRDQEVRAYQLLTQTYLIIDDPIGAEQSYLNLLRANPEYVSSPDRDPIDVVYFSKKFTATPIFSWYLNVGGNLTRPSITQYNKINTGTNENYSPRIGWSLGGGLIYNYNDRITAEVGVNIVNASFRSYETGIFVHDRLTMIERQYALQIPLILKYTYIRKGVSPYIFAGASSNFLLSANQNYLFENRTPSYNGNEISGFASQDTERDNNVKFRRSLTNQAIQLGAGARYKYKLDYFFADVRLGIGLNNMVSREKIVEEGNSSFGSDIYTVGYVDDYFKLNQLFITVGYIKPLYKPRKLKRTRNTKNVLRDIKKQEDDDNQ